MVVVSVIALLGVGAVGTWTTRSAQVTVDSLIEDTMPSIAMLGEIQSTFLWLEVEASGHIATKEPKIKDVAQKNVDEAYKKLEASFAAYAKVVGDESGQKMLATEQELLRAYMPLVAQMMEASRAYDVDAATGIMFGKLRPISQKLQLALHEHAEHNRKLADAVRLQSEKQAAVGSLISWVGMALAAGLVLGFKLPVALAQSKSVRDPDDVNAWLSIASDGTVTIMVPSAEIGQGAYTSAPMLIAEELECDWRPVRAQLAPTDPVYANRMFKVQATASSTSTRWAYEPLRRIGAAARIMLVEA